MSGIKWWGENNIVNQYLKKKKKKKKKKSPQFNFTSATSPHSPARNCKLAPLQLHFKWGER